MNKLAAFIFISCLLAYCVGTDQIDCGDLKSAACKIKFGEQYERLFKEMHLATINDLYNSVKSMFTNIINELPKDDEVSIKLKDTMKTLSENIELLNANTDDNKRIAEIIADMINSTRWGSPNSLSSSIYKSLAEKYKMEEILSKKYYSFINDMAKLYTDMYAGLRDIDLKDYPEYDTLNQVMKNIRVLSQENNLKSIPMYASTKDYFGTTFNLPYLTAVTNVI